MLRRTVETRRGRGLEDEENYVIRNELFIKYFYDDQFNVRWDV
jgi:hypothetical protein